MTEILITGVGVVSPYGIGVGPFWDGLSNSRSPLRELTGPRAGAGSVGGEVPEFDAKAHLGAKGLRTLDRITRFALIAAAEAASSGRLDLTSVGAGLAVVLGTAFGPLASMMEFIRERIVEGPNFVTASLFPNTSMNAPASQVAIRHRLVGANTTLSSGTASGLDAIGYGMSLIRSGRASMVMAGGAEELCVESLAHLKKVGLLPAVAPSEGAAFLLLERADHARARHAEPLAKVSGHASAFAWQRPSRTTVAQNMEAALRSARLDASRVSLVVSGCNGYGPTDDAESSAVRELFERARTIQPKSLIGESLGTSGVFGVIAALMTMRSDRAIGGAITNCVSYSGHLSSLVLERVDA